MRFTDVRPVAPGKMIVDGLLGGDDAPTAFTSLVEVCDEPIVSVRAYFSERTLLEPVGVVDEAAPPR